MADKDTKKDETKRQDEPKGDQEELDQLREQLEPQATYDPDGAAKVAYAGRHPEARNYFGPAEREVSKMEPEEQPTKI